MRADYDKRNKIIKQEDIEYLGTMYFISTVDLGLDHGCCGDTGEFWETMVFLAGDWSDLYCRRYKTKEAAVRGHKQTVADLKSGKLLSRKGGE